MKRLLLYIGIALAAIGCTKDADVDTPSGDNALTFTSNITTRADKSAWADTDAIGVYMTSTDFGDGGANKEYTTNGDGKFSSTDPLYLPASGSVKIFAYYPYKDFDNESDFSLTGYSIDSEEQVDILSATNDNVSSSNVALQFDHLLSKVSLTIEAGTGVSLADLDELVVTISGIGTKTDGFNLTEPAVEVTFSESTELKFDTSITKEDNNVTAISSSAIVIPQTLSGATLIFTTVAGDKYSATIPADEFETGLEYTYAITIKESSVEITSATINKWGDGEATSGTADIVDIEGKSDGILYINSAAGLKAFADLVNGVENTSAISAGVTFSTTPQTEIQGVLTRDIDLSTICYESGDNWTPIGKTSTTMFAGTFNGGGYCVSGLYISSGSKLGLFGYLDEAGVVYNLGVEGDIFGTTDSWETAGVVAYNYGWVMNCYSEVDVTGGTNVGGIVAYNLGNVVNCYNHGNVSGITNIGGIVGQSAAGGYVGYCYSVGEIGGTTRVGGVVGYNHLTTSTAPTIKGCFCLDLDGADYSIGQLESAASSGGYDGNMYDDTYLKSDVFAAIMNNGTYTYNQNEGEVHAVNTYNIQACAWNDNSTSDYPTLNFGVVNSTTNWIYDISYNETSRIYEIYSGLGLKAFAYLVNGESIEDLIEDDKLATSGHYDTYYNKDYLTDNNKISGKLMYDIDLGTVCGSTLDDGNGINWTPIGSPSNQFEGTFDGGNFMVSEIYIDNSSSNNQGLFGYLGSDGIIKNLGVAGTIDGFAQVGGVVGQSDGSVTNCYNTATVSGDAQVGGVVGFSLGSAVTNCYNTATVSGSYVGGIVGYSMGGSVTNCYNTATVSGNDQVGGVVGASEGSVASCYYLNTNSIGVGNVATDVDVNTLKMTEADMKATSFITLLNGNAYTYNAGNPSATQACAWKAVSGSYPTLSFGTDPEMYYWTLDMISAQGDNNTYPTGNVWYITDTDADGTADDATDFEGLENALEVANTSGNITVIFSNLETLPEAAFDGCTALTSISLPSVTTIESAAFCGCTALTSVTLPSATSIGQTAFASCTSLTSLELPSATEIGEDAFYGCSALTTLDLGSSGSGITSIGENAFYETDDTTIAGDIDLTIKISGDGVSVDENALTYNTSETATFKSITVITNWALND